MKFHTPKDRSRQFELARRKARAKMADPQYNECPLLEYLTHAELIEEREEDTSDAFEAEWRRLEPVLASLNQEENDQ